MSNQATAKVIHLGSARAEPQQQAERNVQTVYYAGKTVVKINRAVHANNAVLRCVDHMQHNHYGATVAEILDGTDLHAVIRRRADNTVVILFKREVKED